MNAMDLFVYTASVGIIVLLIFASIAFYMLYRALSAARSFIHTAEGLVAGMRLIKTGAAITAFKFMRTLLQKVRGGE